MTAADEQEVDRSEEALAERRDNLAARGITTAPTHIEGVTVTARVDPAIRPEPQRTRATRSDKGTKRAPKIDADVITLAVTLEQARFIALSIYERDFALASVIQDMIIAQLQRRIDRLAKNGRE